MTQNVSSMAVPLVVDLDGTLTPTDTLVESLVLLVRSNPVYLLLIPFWLLFGRAGFKQRVADRVLPDVEALPLRAGLVDYLRAQRATGRRLVLATAADGRIAHRVAARLGLFDEVLASEAGHNLKGTNKLAAIRARVGERFVYAGDTQADLPIWRAATAAIPVGVASSLRAKLVAESISVEREFPAEAAGWRDWLRALRVHQWLKNVLIFVPILTAFVFSDPARVQAAVFAFIAFSLMASATYIVNDLWDLDNDRRHPRKCQRPFAAARLPIGQGVAAAAGLLLAALVPALQLSPIFVALLLLYLLMTSAYSWVLKRYVLIDVVMLASLYTLRIVAGAAAAHVVVSVWLLAFSVFVFMRRTGDGNAERGRGRQRARLPGRRSGRAVALWRRCRAVCCGRIRPLRQRAGNGAALRRAATALVCRHRPAVLAGPPVGQDRAWRDARRPAGLRGARYRQPGHGRVHCRHRPRGAFCAPAGLTPTRCGHVSQLPGYGT